MTSSLLYNKENGVKDVCLIIKTKKMHHKKRTLFDQN